MFSVRKDPFLLDKLIKQISMGKKIDDCNIGRDVRLMKSCNFKVPAGNPWFFFFFFFFETLLVKRDKMMLENPSRRMNHE